MIFGVDALVWLGLFLLLFALFCVAYAVTIALDGLHDSMNSALAVMFVFIAGVFLMLVFKCFGVY
nr:MAG TPA: hypothetical protein [Caudoviricetes sp.]